MAGDSFGEALGRRSGCSLNVEVESVPSNDRGGGCCSPVDSCFLCCPTPARIVVLEDMDIEEGEAIGEGSNWDVSSPGLAVLRGGFWCDCIEEDVDLALLADNCGDLGITVVT